MWISKKELDVMKLEEYEKGYDKGYEDGLEEGNPFFRIGKILGEFYKKMAELNDENDEGNEDGDSGRNPLENCKVSEGNGIESEYDDTRDQTCETIGSGTETDV